MKTSTQVRPNGSARRAAKQGRKITKTIKQWCRQNPGKARLVRVPNGINKKSLAAALAAALGLPAAAKQAPTKPESASLPHGKPSTVTLLFYSWATEDNLGEADIPDEQFRCLAAAAQRAGQPVSEFVAQGMGAILEKMDGRAATQAPTKPVAESDEDDASPFGWVTITRVAILGLLRAAAPVSLSMSEIAERIRSENGFAVSNDEVAGDLQLLLHTDPPCVKIEAGKRFTITPDGLKVDKFWMVNVGTLPVLTASARAENDGGIQTVAGAGAGVLAAVPENVDRQTRRADELEGAINQAAALNELLEHRILHLDGAGGYSDEIQCGLIELSAETFNRLRRAAGDEQQAA